MAQEPDKKDQRSSVEKVKSVLPEVWALVVPRRKLLAGGLVLIVVSRLAVISRTEVDPPVLAAGGVIMGAGICAMHYTGMAAMRMAPPIEYDLGLFLASMVIAVTASTVAVWLAFRLRVEDLPRRLAYTVLAAVVMGFAIAGMHYTAMAAANFDANAICAVSGRLDVDNERLAYGIAGAVLLVLGLTLALPATLGRKPA